MIKASVKRTDVIFEELPELNEADAKHNNESNIAAPINIGPVITARIYYVKVKKVFKVRRIIFLQTNGQIVQLHV